MNECVYMSQVVGECLLFGSLCKTALYKLISATYTASSIRYTYVVIYVSVTLAFKHRLTVKRV